MCSAWQPLEINGHRVTVHRGQLYVPTAKTKQAASGSNRQEVDRRGTREVAAEMLAIHSSAWGDILSSLGDRMPLLLL